MLHNIGNFFRASSSQTQNYDSATPKSPDSKLTQLNSRLFNFIKPILNSYYPQSLTNFYYIAKNQLHERSVKLLNKEECGVEGLQDSLVMPTPIGKWHVVSSPEKIRKVLGHDRTSSNSDYIGSAPIQAISSLITKTAPEDRKALRKTARTLLSRDKVEAHYYNKIQKLSVKLMEKLLLSEEEIAQCNMTQMIKGLIIEILSHEVLGLKDEIALEDAFKIVEKVTDTINQRKTEYVLDDTLPLFGRLRKLFGKADKDFEDKKLKIKKAIESIKNQKDSLLKEGKHSLILDLLRSSELKDESLVVDFVTLLFFAGQETTISSLNFILYQLGQNVEWQDLIYEKWKEFPNKSNVLEFIKQTPEIQHIIYEGLRLHPPLYCQSRLCNKDTQLENLAISKGDWVQLMHYTSQRRPDIWENPDKFDPSRFKDTPLKDLEKRMMPFGTGPNSCVGKNLALLELETILVNFIVYFRWETKNIGIPQSSAITLQLKDDVKIHLDPRDMDPVIYENKFELEQPIDTI
ncbi:MAG: Cytochrome hydroxylase [Chlamydiales bacterium]|jgi:cytochrome P450|nr:Cytochrome hydroxylase [Chlamydiales bacterium]